MLDIPSYDEGTDDDDEDTSPYKIGYKKDHSIYGYDQDIGKMEREAREWNKSRIRRRMNTPTS